MEQAIQRRNAINEMLELSLELGRYIWSPDYTEDGFKAFEDRISSLRDSLEWGAANE